MTSTTTKTPAIACTIVGSMLNLDFADGTWLELDANNLSDDIRQAALMHGLKQKLVDAGALARNLDTGKTATLQDKIDAVREVYDRIRSQAGTWNKIRGDGAGAGNSGLLVRALMRLTGQARDVVEDNLEGMSTEEKTALRNMPKVAAIIAEFKAATSKIDTNALLDRFAPAQ